LLGGVAIGRTVYLEGRDHEIFRYSIEAAAVSGEIERFRSALAAATEEVERTRERVREQVGGDLAEIFEAHRLILSDALLLGRIEERIVGELVNSEWAVHETSHELQAQFARIDTPHLSERGDDLRDVTRYLLRALQGVSAREPTEVTRGVIVIAHELTPSEALRLARRGVAGIALEGGGATSHTTIVARALDVPLIVGLGEGVASSAERELAVLDADTGLLILDPAPETVADYRRRLEERQRRIAEDANLALLPALTRDGVAIELSANIEFPEELAEALRQGAAGIGLYRSEFLFIERSPQLPTEEEHYEVFCNLLRTMSPRPVVVRTFDLGGRKLARELFETWEENPNLGLRGIRLTLVRPHIFRSQLRALFRAAALGDLRIMIPLVSNLEEVRAFKAFCRSVVGELAAEGLEHRSEVPLGAMIEVPAAALLARQLADELDFLSIGTNDLIQYTLAVDRSNEHVAGLYQPLHPAIVFLLFHIMEQVSGKIPVSLCGEMASDPRLTPLLLLAGLRHLSMSPRSIPAVKRSIRGLDLGAASGAVARIRAAATALEVEQLVEQFLDASCVAESPK
jgi:phosphotransferase system enzyme I (PtsI)